MCANKRLTQRAADKWDSPRFTDIFLALGLYCPQAESASRPLAANASRWAQRRKIIESLLRKLACSILGYGGRSNRVLFRPRGLASIRPGTNLASSRSSGNHRWPLLCLWRAGHLR